MDFPISASTPCSPAKRVSPLYMLRSDCSMAGSPPVNSSMRARHFLASSCTRGSFGSVPARMCARTSCISFVHSCGAAAMRSSPNIWRRFSSVSNCSFV